MTNQSVNFEETQTAKPKDYSLLAKTFHWGMAAIFVYGIIKQVGNLGQLEDSALLRFEVIFAISFLILLALRFAYMTRTQSSALSQDTHRLHKLAARAVHYGIYASLGMIAISGLMIGALFSLGLKTGFLMSGALELHDLSVQASYLLILAHIAASIYHRLMRTGVWSAMVPFWRE